MKDENKKECIILPLIITKGIVVFPGMTMHFDITEEKYLEALKIAAMTDRRVLVVCQSNYDASPDEKTNVYHVGCVSEVKQILTTPNNSTRIMIEGVERAKIIAVSEFEKYNVAKIVPFKTRESKLGDNMRSAYLRTLKQLFKIGRAHV